MYNEQRLIQYQCQREGTLFYYQHIQAYWTEMHCPLCGTTRIEATGRTYKAVNESKPLPVKARAVKA